MNTVGIIGGLGTDTTAKFYMDTVRLFQKQTDSLRPNVLINSVSGSHAQEKHSFQDNKGMDYYFPLLIHAAQRLEKADADFLVIPCNSVHLYIEDIRAAVSIPVLSILEETVSFLKRNKLQTVGIVSSLVTVHHKLYEAAFEKSGIQYKKPDDEQQKSLGEIIINLLQGEKTNKDRQRLQEIVDSFKHQNVDCVILACTDLQLLEPLSNVVHVFDTMKILVEATVKVQMHAKIKKETANKFNFQYPIESVVTVHT